MGFDLLIFDFDGTLVDTRIDITNSVNDMLSHFRKPTKGVEEVTSYIGDGIKKIVERSVGLEDGRDVGLKNGRGGVQYIGRKNDGDEVDLEAAVSVFKESYGRRLLENTVPYPWVLEALGGLRDKVKAVLTNKAYEYTKAISDGLGLTPFFAVILGGDSVKNRKPATEGVELILKRTGLARTKVVMVGDGPNDVLTAKNAGIASVFVTYGFNHLDMVQSLQPDFIINDPRELFEIC